VAAPPLHAGATAGAARTAAVGARGFGGWGAAAPGGQEAAAATAVGEATGHGGPEEVAAGWGEIVNNESFPNEHEIREGSDAAWGWMFDRYPMLVGMHHPPFGSDGIQSHDSAVCRTMCERYCWIRALLRGLGAYLRWHRDRDE